MEPGAIYSLLRMKAVNGATTNPSLPITWGRSNNDQKVKYVYHTVDGRNPAPVQIGSLSHYSQVVEQNPSNSTYLSLPVIPNVRIGVWGTAPEVKGR